MHILNISNVLQRWMYWKAVLESPSIVTKFKTVSSQIRLQYVVIQVFHINCLLSLLQSGPDVLFGNTLSCSLYDSLPLMCIWKVGSKSQWSKPKTLKSNGIMNYELKWKKKTINLSNEIFISLIWGSLHEACIAGIVGEQIWWQIWIRHVGKPLCA